MCAFSCVYSMGLTLPTGSDHGMISGFGSFTAYGLNKSDGRSSCGLSTGAGAANNASADMSSYSSPPTMEL